MVPFEFSSSLKKAYYEDEDEKKQNRAPNGRAKD
jgi:hypothetical protein